MQLNKSSLLRHSDKLLNSTKDQRQLENISIIVFINISPVIATRRREMENFADAARTLGWNVAQLDIIIPGFNRIQTRAFSMATAPVTSVIFLTCLSWQNSSRQRQIPSHFVNPLRRLLKFVDIGMDIFWNIIYGFSFRSLDVTVKNQP